MIKKLKPYFILLIVLLIAYLPLSTFHFGMKNDAFSENFPNKFFLSAAIHSGVSPLWNPYLNYGYPVYADYGFAFWNPITWVFALIGYSAYTLTLEVLLYIFIAGIAMYRLAKYFRLQEFVALSIACCYMCSGFFIGHLQHINFLTGAAFLPFALKYFFKLFDLPGYKNSFAFAISSYFIAVCGHPDIPIGALYFFMILFSITLFTAKKEKGTRLKITAYFLLSIFLLCCFLAPMIYAYSNILTDCKNNAAENIRPLMNGSFTLKSLISFIFPFSTIAHSSFFLNDASSRNIYLSLGGFLFFLFGFKTNKKFIQPLLISGLFLFFLSLGEPFKSFFSKIPLLHFVRTNAEYRVFTILCCCCIAGFGMEYFIEQKEKSALFLKKISGMFLLANIAAMIVLFICRYTHLKSFFENCILQNSFAAKTKYFFDNINFSEAVFINFIIAISICCFYFFRKKYSSKFLFAIIIVDLAVNTILYLPVTGIGQVTLSKIQNYYDNNAKGIPVPQMIAQNNIDTFESVTTGLIGSEYYYNKNIGQTQQTIYPSYFPATKKYFESGIKDSVSKMPFVFLKNNLEKKIIDSNIQVEKFSPTNIIVNVSSENTDTLVFLQNNYKFWSAKVNGSTKLISTSYYTFLSVPVQKGMNRIELNYEDKNLKWFFCLSIICFIICLFILIRRKTLK